MNVQLPPGDYLCMCYIPLNYSPFIMVCYQDKIIHVYLDGLCEIKQQKGFYDIVNYMTSEQCMALDSSYNYPSGGILVTETIRKKNHTLWDLDLTHRFNLDIITIQGSPLTTRYGNKSIIYHENNLHIMNHDDNTMKIHKVEDRLVPYHIDENSMVFIQGSGSKCYDWDMNLLWCLEFPDMIYCGHNNKWFIRDINSRFVLDGSRENFCYLDQHGLIHYTNIPITSDCFDLISYNDNLITFNEKTNTLTIYTLLN